LRDFSFIEEDLEDTIEKIQLSSFKGSLRNEVYQTLNMFQEILLLDLEKYEIFSSLKSVEEKKLVIFYLLLRCLPDIVNERLKKD